MAVGCCLACWYRAEASLRFPLQARKGPLESPAALIDGGFVGRLPGLGFSIEAFDNTANLASLFDADGRLLLSEWLRALVKNVFDHAVCCHMVLNQGLDHRGVDGVLQ